MANAYRNHWTPEDAIDKLYNKLFDSDSTGLLQTLVDSIELDENANFWAEHFIVEGNEYKIDLADKDIPFLRERMLTMYANPLRNKMK